MIFTIYNWPDWPVDLQCCLWSRVHVAKKRTYIAQDSLSMRSDPEMVVIEILNAFHSLVGGRPVRKGQFC